MNVIQLQSSLSIPGGFCEPWGYQSQWMLKPPMVQHKEYSWPLNTTDLNCTGPHIRRFFFSVNIQPASSGFSPSDSNNCRSKFLYLVGWICEMLWKEESTACHLNFPGKWVCLHIRAFNSSKNWLNHMQHRFRIKDCWSFSRIQSPSSVQPGRCKVHLPKERT